MQYEEVSWYSDRLQRHMNIKIYGHYGPAIIVFPCQNQMSNDFYLHGTIDILSGFIDSGACKLFCLDSVDQDSISYEGWDKAHAAYILEQYFHYVIEEVLPLIYNKQQGYCLPYVLGISSGASHAANMFFRRPDKFQGILAMSGCYDLARYFNGYFNDDVYNNSPVHYLSNMSDDHPYLAEYNKKNIIFVVGSGYCEDQVLYSNYWLSDICNNKKIFAVFNFLGPDHIHDWPTWNNDIGHYLNYLLKY